jgi:hypothetical protein
VCARPLVTVVLARLVLLTEVLPELEPCEGSCVDTVPGSQVGVLGLFDAPLLGQVEAHIS